jgi:large subunit ribosomal protein L29
MKRKELLKDLRSNDDGGLKTKLLSLSEELMKLRFRKATGQLQQSHKVKELRKQVAIIKTVIYEKANKIEGKKPGKAA